MDDDFNWGLCAGLTVANLLFWFFVVPWFEQREPGQYDFIKGLCIGVMAGLLTLASLHLTKIGT